MKDTLKAGLKKTMTFEVDDARAIRFLADGPEAKGTDGRVYATPSIVLDVETVCHQLLAEHLDEGEDSLGTYVAVEHLAPTLMGMTATITAEITAVDGRAVSFTATVGDGVDEEVARGKHNRHVIEVARVRKRLKAKAEAAGVAG